ncbi:ileal sodium/bile acid cotransporter-like [Watersipora subatra]|uniref:ileal sodium/bile acid cotransporter-like n=1 Tax=Watersipora subatra TaxID=2589382 RepID=UPI00355BB881
MLGLICTCFFFVAASLASPDDVKGNRTNSDFKLVTPNNELFTIYYDTPPTHLTAILYTSKMINNFTVSVASMKTSVATVSEEVNITPCQVETNHTIPATGDHKADLEMLETCYNLSFYGTSVYIGYSTIKFYVSMNGSDENVYIDSVLLRAIRRRRTLDMVYDLSFKVIIIIAIMAMGTDLEFDIIKRHLKRPKAPGIALLSQFLIMPLLAYGIIWMMGYTGGKALGFFAMGCSPGGGTSNMYAKLFNGDLSLSVTMTTLSTAASLGMLPLWVYTLGTTIPADEGVEKLTLPFVNILESLAFLVIPLAIGVLVKLKLPRITVIIRKSLNVMFFVVAVIILTLMIYVNQYIFVQWNVELMLSACMLPYGGYILGGLFAWICRFEWPLVKTIAIETGLQNTAVSILVAMSLSGQPDNDLAVILPIASTIVAACPFYVTLPIYLLRQRELKKREKKLEKDMKYFDGSKLVDEPQAVTNKIDSTDDVEQQNGNDTLEMTPAKL